MRYTLLHGITPDDEGSWVMYEHHERLLAEARREAFIRGLRYAGYLPRSVELGVARNADWIDGGDER